MKKDIEIPKVVGVEVAVAKDEDSDTGWRVYLINKNDFALANVLVASKGYGQLEGESRKTSTLRHMIGEIGPENYAAIEPIDPKLFVLANEYWVSYYVGNQIYDKKFVFVAGSLKEENCTKIKSLGKTGILHT